MLNLSGMVKAPGQHWDVTMKSTGMSRKNGKARRPEYIVTVTAGDKEEAARVARTMAESEGFTGYAITRIMEVR